MKRSAWMLWQEGNSRSLQLQYSWSETGNCVLFSFPREDRQSEAAPTIWQLRHTHKSDHLFSLCLPPLQLFRHFAHYSINVPIFQGYIRNWTHIFLLPGVEVLFLKKTEKAQLSLSFFQILNLTCPLICGRFPLPWQFPCPLPHPRCFRAGTGS